jgi:hypothetical protein
VIWNVSAAVALVLLGVSSVADQKAGAYVTYQKLSQQKVFVEGAATDVNASLRKMAARSSAWVMTVAWIGAGVCLVNAALVDRHRRKAMLSRTVSGRGS